MSIDDLFKDYDEEKLTKRIKDSEASGLANWCESVMVKAANVFIAMNRAEDESTGHDAAYFAYGYQAAMASMIAMVSEQKELDLFDTLGAMHTAFILAQVTLACDELGETDDDD